MVPVAKSDLSDAQQASKSPKVPALSETITSIISRSEHIPDQNENATEVEREKVRSELLTGKLPFSSSTTIFLIMRVVEDELHGIAWSEEELIVRIP